MKIAVYAISKNEAMFARRFCESAADADLILIADTGSTDDTVQIAREAGATVEVITVSPWRFDEARNQSLALLPDDIDVCVCLDLDEVMEPGWRAEIERVWRPETNRLEYAFDYGSGIKFNAQKIHARHGWRWRKRAHEDLVSDGPTVWAHTEKLLITHHPDPTKSRAQYFDLLEGDYRDDPTDPRTVIYYGRELMFRDRHAEAIPVLKEYLALPDAAWAPERSYAMRLIAQADPSQAEPWLLRAAAEYTIAREPWCDLAQMFHNQGRWAECYSACLRALAITHRDYAYCGRPEAWAQWPHDLAAVSAWNIGLKRRALEHAADALEYAPTDLRLKENLRLMADA